MTFPFVYPKMQSLWKRDMDNDGVIVEGSYSKDEFRNIAYWYVTEKIDGTNIRIIYNAENKTLEFRGRTDNAIIPTKLLDYLDKTFKISKFQKVFKGEHTQVILFGEGYGGYIQHGNKYRKDISFILFDIWISGWWLKHKDVENIGIQLGIDYVPVLGIHTTAEIIAMIKYRLSSDIAIEDIVMEGIVARSFPLVLFRKGNPVMFKLKIKDYEKLKEFKEKKENEVV